MCFLFYFESPAVAFSPNFPAVFWLFAPPWCVSPVLSHCLPRLSVCVCLCAPIQVLPLCSGRLSLPPREVSGIIPRVWSSSFWRVFVTFSMWVFFFFFLLLWLSCLLILLVLPVLPVCLLCTAPFVALKIFSFGFSLRLHLWVRRRARYSLVGRNVLKPWRGCREAGDTQRSIHSSVSASAFNLFGAFSASGLPLTSLTSMLFCAKKKDPFCRLFHQRGSLRTRQC